MLISIDGWPADLLPRILENLESLWADWLAGRRSPEFTLGSFGKLEERLLAHIDALYLAGQDAWPWLEEGLGAGWEASVLASAHAMLLPGDPAWERRVWASFLAADDPAVRSGVLLALRYGPPGALDATLREAAAGGDPSLALPAAAVLARRGSAVPASLRPGDHLDHPQAPVRAAAWRVLAAAGGAEAAAGDRERFLSGLADPEPTVSASAWLAAAWLRRPWLLAHCRDHAVDDPVALRWFALLAGPEDEAAVVAAAAGRALDPGRCEALGSLGTPAAAAALLAALDDPAPRTAVAAAAAFARITGRDVASGERVALPPPEADPTDDLAAEFADEAFLPDAQLAREWWTESGSGLPAGQRCNRGAVLPGEPAATDLLARWESAVRDRYHGRTEDRSFAALDPFPLALGWPAVWSTPAG